MSQNYEKAQSRLELDDCRLTSLKLIPNQSQARSELTPRARANSTYAAAWREIWSLLTIN